MIERFKPPLVVIVVGRPNSEDWCLKNDSGKVEWRFSDDIFRCLSYEIGNPHAGNPAIPVYFSIGDFDSADETSPPPPSIHIALATRVIVVVLLDSGFLRATSRWTDSFDKMRQRAQDAACELQFIPMTRTNDAQLPRTIMRLGLGTTSPVYLRAGDSRRQHLRDAASFFRISIMIAAIKGICGDDENETSIEIFISYARRDGEEVANQLRKAFDDYSGIRPVVDSMTFSPGVSVDGDSLEQKLAESTCVVVCQTASYADRVWCQREALRAKRSDVPMIVVDTRDGIERHSCDSLTNCPHMKLNGKIEDHCEEIVELAISEILRISHHKARCAALLAPAGIDPERVEVLVRTPELLRMIDVAANNGEAARLGRQPKDLIIHPDPPLRDHELNLLKMCYPNLKFLTPSTVHIANPATKEV